METRLTSRGQTVVPAAIRRKHRLVPGTRLQWIDTGTAIQVVPIPGDPVRAARGFTRGERLTDALLKDRAEERRRA